MITIWINNQKISASTGKTILAICREHNIFIPTFCHDERLEPHSACFICVVEIEGKRGLQPACSTIAEDGMHILTDSEKVCETRKMNLELLLSNHVGDCYAPCRLRCPALVDIPGYIALVARKQYQKAVELIRETNPLPLVCGRVCARPCEEVCRRNDLDQSVAIDWIKRFATDYERTHGGPILPKPKPITGKKVAIIGGGPSGLTAAYFLRLQGHQVTIFEKNPEPGGWLRYGIPPYRMPRDLLREEICQILGLNIHLRCNSALGRDFTIHELQQSFHAIYLAMGAQNGSSARAQNEDIDGVIQGVAFLRDFNLGEEFDFTDKKVVIIGGGNTAIDCARTALRLQAAQVTVAYRRTETEMPAHQEEIADARDEGCQFTFLAQPLAFLADNQQLSAIKMMQMQLGAPDASGRRRPEATDDEFILSCDVAILAVGQKVDANGLESIQRENWGTIRVDGATFATNLQGVFAGGDVVRGPDIAIQAIADGRYAALSIHEFLQEKPLSLKGKEAELGFMIRREDVLRPEELQRFCTQFPKAPQAQMPIQKASERVHNWHEVEQGLTEEQALQEAERCFQCGCSDLYECKLKQYADEYGTDPQKFRGEYVQAQRDFSHPFLQHDPAKCILCGNCVRICEDIQGIAAIGYIHRGFRSQIVTDYQKGFQASRCVACGQCISACPVGALAEKIVAPHPGPLPLTETTVQCVHCGDMCELQLACYEDQFVKVQTHAGQGHNEGNLCAKGKFGLAYYADSQSIKWKDFSVDNESIQQFWQQQASNVEMILASPQLPLEQLYAIKQIADTLSVPVSSLYFLGQSIKFDWLKTALGSLNNTITWNEIDQMNLFCWGFPAEQSNSVSQRKIFQLAQKNPLILMESEPTFLAKRAELSLSLGFSVDFWKSFIAYWIQQNPIPQYENYKDFQAQYAMNEDVNRPEFAKLERYFQTKSSVLIMNPHFVSLSLLKQILNLALVTRSRILLLHALPNVPVWEALFGAIEEPKMDSKTQYLLFGESVEAVKQFLPHAEIVAQFTSFPSANQSHLQLPLPLPYQETSSYYQQGIHTMQSSLALPCWGLENWAQWFSLSSFEPFSGKALVGSSPLQPHYILESSPSAVVSGACLSSEWNQWIKDFFITQHLPNHLN